MKTEANSTDIRELLSSFIRRSSKGGQQTSQQRKKVVRSSSCNNSYSKSSLSPMESEFSSSSFLELTSEVSPIEIDDFWEFNCEKSDDKSYGTPISQNGNLWRDEMRKKCAQLAKTLEERLSQVSPEQHGFCLNLPIDLPKRIAKAVASTAVSEPCGLRGCCIHLRLLHEDVATALMSSHDNKAVANPRAEKCASWPEAPENTTDIIYEKEKYPLDFRHLPGLDSTLTEKFNPNSSGDSGFGEGNNSRRRPTSRRGQCSMSTTSLPTLSSASRLQVACADIGRIDCCDSDAVATFEVYVYLAPAISWTWWLRKFFFSSFKTGKGNRNQRNATSSKNSRAVAVLEDFTIVKRKLYRSRSNSLEVIRCTVLK